MAISIPRRAEPIRVPSGRALAFVLGATTFVVLAALFSLSRSSLFALRHVEVEGAGHRSPAEIRALADLGPATNVVWLDTSAVAERILADPWIARATVVRSLPRTVEILVKERSPMAVAENGARGTLVASDGTALGPAGRYPRLPAILLPQAAPTAVAVPSESAAVRLLAEMTPSVRNRVREVDVAVGGTLSLRLQGGVTVDVGEAVQLEEKATALRRLLAWEAETGSRLRAISLVSPSVPAAQLQA